MQRTMGLSGLEPPTSRLSGVRSKPAELQAQQIVRSRLGLSKPESSLFRSSGTDLGCPTGPEGRGEGSLERR